MEPKQIFLITLGIILSLILEGTCTTELIWSLRMLNNGNETKIVRVQGEPSEWIPRLGNASLEQVVQSQSLSGGAQTWFGSLDIETLTNTLFWFDNSNARFGQVMKQTLDDLNAIRRQVTPRSSKGDNILALDWISENVYWLDIKYGQIGVSTYKFLDAKSRLVVADLDTPTAMAVAPEQGYLFWAVAGSQLKAIQRSRLDGSEIQTIVRDRIVRATLLAVDRQEQHIYWTETSYSHLKRADFQGENDEIVWSHIDIYDFPFSAMVVYQDWVFLAREQFPSMVIVDKNTGEISGYPRLAELSSAQWGSFGLAINAVDKQPNVISACSTNRGECDHICVNSGTDGGAVCMCHVGFQLQNDRRTCQADPVDDNFLLFTELHSRELYQMALPSGEVHAVEAGLHTSPLGVAYDEQQGQVYWTDTIEKNIARIAIGGAPEEVIQSLSNDAVPEDIAIDPLNRKLYYTDSGRQEIVSCDLGGSACQVLLALTQDEKPRGIVLDVQQGLLYWADGGLQPKIERYSLTDRERHVMVDSDLSSPNGLAINFQDETMYWCDSEKKRIEKMQLDKVGRTVVAEDSAGSFYRLAVDGEYLYVTDWDFRNIRRINWRVDRPQIDNFGPAFFGQTNGIAVYHSLRETTTTSTTTQPPPTPSTTTQLPTTTPSTTTQPPTTTPSTTPSPVTMATESTPDATRSTRPDTTPTAGASTGEAGTNWTVITIAVVIAGVIFLALIITVGVVVAKRRKHAESSTTEPTPGYVNPTYNGPAPTRVHDYPNGSQDLGLRDVTSTTAVDFGGQAMASGGKPDQAVYNGNPGGQTQTGNVYQNAPGQPPGPPDELPSIYLTPSEVSPQTESVYDVIIE